ncbi:MAG: hypothetical protein OXD42_08005, partial [Rhodospirillaceae bacterium]|nr:hypothetical protein [Rhodospirillaceae bacterium]
SKATIPHWNIIVRTLDVLGQAVQSASGKIVRSLLHHCFIREIVEQLPHDDVVPVSSETDLLSPDSSILKEGSRRTITPRASIDTGPAAP